MNKPRLLDLFCGAGGAGMGYHLAGFEVVGVDINHQKNYPFEFIQADAMTYPLDGFDAIHASPPCQRYSNAQRIQNGDHPDLVPGTRGRLIASGTPYVIENVVGAPLIEPVTLCGAMFPPLKVYRHRLFEASFPISAPAHPAHEAPQAKMGRVPKDGEWMQIVGNWSGKAQGAAAMGIDWMTRGEMSQAIPPAYTKYIGQYLMAEVKGLEMAA